MSRAAPMQAMMPSILDRLIDPETEGTSWRRGYDLQQMVAAVRRDLEDLLNSHPPYPFLPEEWAELRNSLLSYGMPDFSHVNALTTFDRQQIGILVEDIIVRFEPRLRNVKAAILEVEAGLERAVRFHIEAQLNVDPAPEVAFETVVELTTGHTVIKPSETSA